MVSLSVGSLVVIRPGAVAEVLSFCPARVVVLVLTPVSKVDWHKKGDTVVVPFGDVRPAS
jgi:hypothetical protein